MATFFHGNPEIPVGQDGGLQTMVLMNPYVHFNSDQEPAAANHNSNNNNNNNNLLFFNPSNAAVGNFLPAPHHPGGQQFDNVSVLHGFIPRLHYNISGTTSADERETPLAQQGLSLCLSSEEERRRRRPSNPTFGSVSPGSGHPANMVVSGMQQGLVLSSKYLKAAQELLDEMVSVNNAIIDHNSKNELSKKSGSNNNKETTGESVGGGGDNGGGGGGGKDTAELTGAERQEVRIKKAKLVSMLDEVDQRYKQYHHQMKIIVSSFEQAAGIGSAKTYTSLALKTISKQFKSLKDAIVGQIKAVNRSLGEEDGKIEGSSSSSRLRFVDHHLRQQRALQQLGMIHHHTNSAWRPQRGLPERAVSVLRAWLFEHFLHPYPKDSDKLMLAKQTGLTRSQVSNWFINARVRLWKPMVEEMYLEEMKEQGKNNGASEDQKTKKQINEKQDENSASKSIASETDQQNNFILKHDGFMNNNNNHITMAMSVPMTTASASTSPNGGCFRNHPSGFAIVGTSELEGITQGSPKKLRTNELLQSQMRVPSMDMDVNKVGESNSDSISPKFRNEKQFSFIGSNINFIGGFEHYPIGETARFEAEGPPFTPRYSGNNGVSLTLGLPHRENFSVSATHQNFFPNQNIQLGRTVEMAEPNEFGAINSSEPHASAAAYNTISLQNQRRFVAQLLPDFVT